MHDSREQQPSTSVLTIKGYHARDRSLARGDMSCGSEGVRDSQFKPESLQTTSQNPLLRTCLDRSSFPIEISSPFSSP
eukprot:3703321-Rhodomonas_salina.1